MEENKGQNKNKILIIIAVIAVIIVAAGIYLYSQKGISTNVIAESNNSNEVSGSQSQTEQSELASVSPTASKSEPLINENNSTNESASTTDSNKINLVEIIKMKAVPDTITIKAGENVTWLNYDSVPHRLMSEVGSEISGKAFYKNQTWTHKFDTAGTYDYYCTVYPYIKGKVIVE